MTTEALNLVHIDAARPLALSGERVAAVVTAIAFVLLLPATSLLMSVLTA